MRLKKVVCCEDRSVVEEKEKIMKDISNLLLNNKDFMALASCKVINNFRHIPREIEDIRRDFSALSDNKILSDTYIKIQDLTNSIKGCLRFLKGIDRSFFSFSDLNGLKDALTKALYLLEK